MAEIDTISRRAAIETALTFIVEHCGAAFDEDMQRMLKKRLDSLPFVQSERKTGEWISTKDKVPCNQNPVIVSVPPHTNCDGEEYVGYVGMAYFTNSAKGGFWCGTDGNVYGAIGIIETPTHWMPLPEPYKGGQE